MQLRLPVHRTILIVDVEGFTRRRRTNQDQLAVRAGLYHVLEQAFQQAGIDQADCHREDRGDGILVVAETPGNVFAEALPPAIAEQLTEYNAARPAAERIRMRMCLHAGEVCFDEHGVTGRSINLSFRLVDAPALKRALAQSPGVLAMITSSAFFDEVIMAGPAGDQAGYHQVAVAVRDHSVTGWICLPDQPDSAGLTIGPPCAETTTVPRQLPACTPHFVGRDITLGRLTDYAGTGQDTAAIIAINGMAGMGKTVLAVHWAHQVSHRFPDGQLYVNLRGFDNSGPPVQPAEVIRGFLTAFSVPAERVPADLEAQAGLYRTLLAGRRVLIVLDNARDAEQVRPLLPAGPGCTAVVTSRDQLVDLVTREGARPVNLGPFAVDEATTLLALRIGWPRVHAEPDAVADLVERCTRLPLAVAIVAARIELNPRLGMDLLSDDPTAESVRHELRPVFAVSYDHLDPRAARTFRLLGSHPGAEVSTAAAASLAGVPAVEMRAILAELTRANLVTEVRPGRFSLHDLLRDYAWAELSATDTEQTRRAATHRMLDHYLRTSHAANSFFSVPFFDVDTADPAPPGVTICSIRTYQQARTWFATEHPTLLLLIEYAARNGFDEHVWKLTLAIFLYLEWQGHWQDLIAVRQSILTAVDRLGDDFARGRVHAVLGWMYGRVGRPDKANEHATLSLRICRQNGDKRGAAVGHFAAARACGLAGSKQQASDHAGQALQIFTATDDLRGQARAHWLHAWVAVHFGDHHDAIDHCRRSIELFRTVGRSLHELATLENLLAWNHQQLGAHREAIVHYREAAGAYQELADQYNQAGVRRRLGDAWHAVGDIPSAQASWRQALAILEKLCLPDQDPARVKLRERLQSTAQPPDPRAMPADGSGREHGRGHAEPTGHVDGRRP